MPPETDEDGVVNPLVKVFSLDFASEKDLNDLLEGYRQEESCDLFQVTREQYVADRDANTRGTANPSVMNKPFWLFQVSPGGSNAWTARTTFGNAEDPFEDSDGPVWCFDRFGTTRTKLPDGRVVCIGGEHEDGYDPDFCIYNDVVVFDPPQRSDPLPLLTPKSIKIYGYPVEIFPPTDFHTSTYFADPTTGKESIIIVGGLGYGGQASGIQTEVYQLDLTDFSIRRRDTSGVGPSGGIHHHKAELVTRQGQAAIMITTEEVKELVDTEGGKDSPTAEEGEKFPATGESSESTTQENGNVIIGAGDVKGFIPKEESEGSITAPESNRELVTTEESKIFTLRIHDMRWI